MVSSGCDAIQDHRVDNAPCKTVVRESDIVIRAILTQLLNHPLS